MDDRPYGLLLICYQKLKIHKRLFYINYFVILKRFFINCLMLKTLRQNAPERALIAF